MRLRSISGVVCGGGGGGGGGGAVCVCVCLFHPLLGRARETTCDRATHRNDLRSSSGEVCVGGGGGGGCGVCGVYVCVFVVFDPSYIEHVWQRAIARRIATIALDQRRAVW